MIVDDVLWLMSLECARDGWLCHTLDSVGESGDGYPMWLACGRPAKYCMHLVEGRYRKGIGYYTLCERHVGIARGSLRPERVHAILRAIPTE